MRIVWLFVSATLDTVSKFVTSIVTCHKAEAQTRCDLYFCLKGISSHLADRQHTLLANMSNGHLLATFYFERHTLNNIFFFSFSSVNGVLRSAAWGVFLFYCLANFDVCRAGGDSFGSLATIGNRGIIAK